MDGTLIHRRIIPQVIILVVTIYIDLERVCGAKLLIWETTRWQSATCMWRMWLEQKNTQRELRRNKAFVKKGSSWDTARKKENVKLNVKLYIDHKLQTCCRFILIHIHMYLPMLVPAEAISIANNSRAFLWRWWAASHNTASLGVLYSIKSVDKLVLNYLTAFFEVSSSQL